MQVTSPDWTQPNKTTSCCKLHSDACGSKQSGRGALTLDHIFLDCLLMVVDEGSNRPRSLGWWSWTVHHICWLFDCLMNVGKCWECSYVTQVDDVVGWWSLGSCLLIRGCQAFLCRCNSGFSFEARTAYHTIVCYCIPYCTMLVIPYYTRCTAYIFQFTHTLML